MMEVTFGSTPKEDVERPAKDPNDASLPESGRRRKASFFAGMAEAFRVDFSPRPYVKDLLDSYIRAMDGDCGTEELETDIRVNRIWGDNKTLVPGSSVTAARIKRMYDNLAGDSEETLGDAIVCILKLCLAEIACGETMVSVEEHFRRVCIALEVDEAPEVFITQRMVQAQFRSGPVVIVGCKRGIQISKLRQIAQLSVLVQKGHATGNAKAASLVVDKIMEEESSYGWAIADMGTLGLQCAGCVAQFYGAWEDMAAVAACSFVWLLFRRLVMRRYALLFGSIEILVVAFLTGAVASLVWRYFYHPRGYEVCHVFTIFISSMYVYYPGSDIVYGAYEVYVGLFVHGSGRLISALIRIMYMAFGLLIGWQTFGRGLMNYGSSENEETPDYDPIRDSLLLGGTCPAFTTGIYNIEPWWLVAFVFSLVLTPLALMEFGVRPRGMLIPGITTYAILALNEVFHHGCRDGNSCTSLPSYINNAILFFIAANIAYLFDYLYFYPAQNSLSSVILIFAPGASTTVRILNQMGRENGITDESGILKTASDLFANVGMVGVSYALGILVASSYWSIIMARKDVNGTSNTTESMKKRTLVYFSYNNGREY